MLRLGSGLHLEQKFGLQYELGLGLGLHSSGFKLRVRVKISGLRIRLMEKRTVKFQSDHEFLHLPIAGDPNKYPTPITTHMTEYA